MPNRLIKESICTSTNLDKLTPEQECLFYRIMVNCDDFGRMESGNSIIRSKCFPLKIDSLKADAVESWLFALVKEGLIILYEIEGKRYLQLCTWERHQQIRAKRSKYPNPNGSVMTSDINCNQLLANVPVIQSNPIQSNPIQSESNTDSTCKQVITPASKQEKKDTHGEFENVFLSEDEYQKLTEKLGNGKADDLIEQLSGYMRQTIKNAKKYTDHYATILNWSRRDERKDGAHRGSTQKLPKQYTRP